MEITTIGIDLAKSMFAVSGADERGAVVLRKQLRRAQVLAFMAKLEPCVVGLEACGGAHHWARAMAKLGHEVRLLSPRLVKPYRTSPNKHDRNDADAICEAVRRPQLRQVEVKSVAQQDLLALHRVRTQLLKHRIAQSNLLRALLHERGVIARPGAKGLRTALADALAHQERNEVSGALGAVLLELSGGLRQLEQRIAAISRRLERAASDDERCRRLMEVPGAGPLTATALVATVGNAREFKSGRALSAYLGLTPRQHSSGGKIVMLGISKHGDRYLRTLLIHGARSLLYRNRRGAHPRAAWAARLMARRGPNVAAVALANHNARVLWALLSRGSSYCPTPQRSFPSRPSTVVKRAREGKLLIDQSERR
jgi:transposase